jgi:DNA-directed RNA polymerase specialized sigma subunit
MLPLKTRVRNDNGAVRQANIGFAAKRRSYTKVFERYALELSRHMTIKDVAEHLGVGWDLVKQIQKRYLTKKYKRLSLENTDKIAIDEIWHWKRSRLFDRGSQLDNRGHNFRWRW